jgi:hypothetical protein
MVTVEPNKGEVEKEEKRGDDVVKKMPESPRLEASLDDTLNKHLDSDRKLPTRMLLDRDPTTSEEEDGTVDAELMKRRQKSITKGEKKTKLKKNNKTIPTLAEFSVLATTLYTAVCNLPSNEKAAKVLYDAVGKNDTTTSVSSLIWYLRWCPAHVLSRYSAVNMDKSCASVGHLHYLLQEENIKLFEKTPGIRDDVKWRLYKMLNYSVTYLVPDLVRSYNINLPLHAAIAEERAVHMIAALPAHERRCAISTFGHLVTPEKVLSYCEAGPMAMSYSALKELIQQLLPDFTPGAVDGDDTNIKLTIILLRLGLPLTPSMAIYLADKGDHYLQRLQDMTFMYPWLQGFISSKRSELLASASLGSETILSWNGTLPDAWRVLTSALEKHQTKSWMIGNGGAHDAGGVSKEFWNCIGEYALKELLEAGPDGGPLLPKLGVTTSTLNTLGEALAYAVFGFKTALGIELHPALLCMLSYKWCYIPSTTGKNMPGVILRSILGAGTLMMIAPRAAYLAKEHPDLPITSFTSELLHRYRKQLPGMLAIVDGWNKMKTALRIQHTSTETPDKLLSAIMGDRSCDVDRLDAALLVRDYIHDDKSVVARNVSIYRQALLDELRRLSLAERREFYRFWFGTEQPTWNDDKPCAEIVRAPDRPNVAVSHTCSNGLEIKYLATDDEQPPTTERLGNYVREMLQNTLENQRRAVEVGLRFQMY